MTHTKSKIQILSLILFLLSSQMVLATEIKTSMDRNPVNINESFQVIFTATQSPDGEPDFSPLEKDFDILSKSQQNNASWINGKSSNTIQWIVNLMAKQAGNLSIPAISFGKDVSQPVTLLVKKSTAEKSTKKNQDLFLEVETSSKTPYVQAQVIYTLKFYRKVQITQASLNEPELEDAIIEKLGDDKNYNTEINGVTYLVTERKYAIFPQKSGSKTIKPLILTADIISNSRSRFNGFFNTPSTQTQRVTSKQITLDVQAAPEDFTGKRWIPAEHVYIEQKWSGDINKIKTGEPLTRTLTILAKGTTVAQLPELHTESASSKLKTYPDQPVLKEQKNEDGLIAFREEKIAYIPSESGSFNLPAIEVLWFNTLTKKMDIAKIPGTTITAIASAQSATETPQALSPTQINTVKSEPIIRTEENNVWMWFSVFLAIGWLTTLYFLFKKINPKQEILSENPTQLKLKDAIKKVKQACKDNDQTAAKNALLSWGRLKFNETNLSATSSHCEARLRDEIHLLNQNLYASHSEKWNGKKLLQTFTENNAREKIATKANDALEPLFKV